MLCCLHTAVIKRSAFWCRTGLISGQLCLSDSQFFSSHTAFPPPVLSPVPTEHVQVQVRERHPPGRAPQAGAVRRQAGQFHLLHLQRQGDGRPALLGVFAEGKPIHLRPFAARAHAAGL